jgi:quinol monooxygenase YgiN
MLLVMGYLRVRFGDIDRLRAPIIRQVAAASEFHGCEGYSFGIDLLEPDLFRIAERWRTRAAQAAHLIGDHMVEFNIAMRAGKVVETLVDSYEGGTVRQLLQIPATSFRAERREEHMVIVMGTARLGAGEIARLRPAMEAQIAATRAEDGCEHYAFAVDVGDPDLLHISERWRDHAAIEAHFASPHMAAFNAALAGAKVLELRVVAYDAQGERVLMGG